jgi:purine-binding chemotaxis protein CheW
VTEREKTAGNVPLAGIDWIAIHRRLENASLALERRIRPTGEERARILTARAKALAREPVHQQRPEQSVEVVEFLLAHERYALDAAFVREVCPLREITQLPATPAFVLGIISVRGQIVSIIDLKQFFDLPQSGLTDFNKVIILRDGSMELGLLADALVGVHRVPLANIQPPLPTLTGIRAEYLRGVTEQRLVMLDVARILADPRIIVREQVQA